MNNHIKCANETQLNTVVSAMLFAAFALRLLIYIQYTMCPSVILLYFQATVGDQTVIEGQEVIMSVRMTGQPKPMLYW